jgi:hypothetical protein
MSCFNTSCPFRDKNTNECHLYQCDYAGGTGHQPQEEKEEGSES